MLFRQIIHEDLGCASYLFADRESGVAVVVDPQWEVDAYRRLARLHGVRIGHIIETHNHADHVSGHGRLVRQTGATIHIHESAEAEYAHEPFGDGWKLTLGDLTVEAIHTPGHRPEHTCFLLSDAGRGDAPWALLSGDSLFIGDVARPDLAIEPREGAAQMFHSLHERLLALDDEVEVWPGHLGGSLCGGAGIDLKSSSTIGFERAHNPALAIADEADFVERATSSLPDRPPNVEQIVALNRGPLIEGFGAPAAMIPHEVEAAVAAGAVVIDGRTNEEFDEAHIAGALSTSAYDTGFATKVSRVAPPGVEIIVVAANDVDECEAAELLAAVGLRVRGFLEGGMTAWRTDGRAIERIELINPEELARRVGPDGPLVLDVRNDSEYAGEHIPDSLHIPYGDIAARVDELPRDRQIAAICRGGKRSGLAASILQREGFADVIHVGKGVGAWRAAGNPVESGTPGSDNRAEVSRLAADIAESDSNQSILAAVAITALASLALFVASASATFEATMVTRAAGKRADGPTFIVEAGGGRRTRIRNLAIETGACGSIFVPLIDAGRVKPGFNAGNGAAVFGKTDQDLHLLLELRVKPRGEGLIGTGLLKATVGTCHERVPLDLVSESIRGGGRHKPTP